MASDWSPARDVLTGELFAGDKWKTNSMHNPSAVNRSVSGPGSRIALVDFGRGVALVAMTVFHFCWDLAMFRLVDPSLMIQPGMIWFARSIAGSFLFLAGFSLYLAHGRGIRWRGYAIRLLKILAAAALITLATWFATPEAFIFFGILHSIALASMLGLAFMPLPWWLTAAAGLFIACSRLIGLHSAAFNAPWWWWSGLSQFLPVSNDYVPIFPFFGMVLLGIAAAKLVVQYDLTQVLARPRLSGAPAPLLRFIGRHSLVYYLAHQPVMIAILYALLYLSGRI